MTEANQRFQSGDYRGALKLYSRGLDNSRKTGDTLNAACFLAGIGNYYVVAHQYREALAAYDIAGRDALEARYPDFALRLAVNRATLYRRMGEKAAAIEAMKAVRDIVPSPAPAWLLIQAGNLAADDHGIDAAAPYFFAASDRAADEDDVATQASALAQLGYLQLRAGNLKAAEDALVRAFRIKKLTGNRQLGSLYFHLGALRVAQGKPESAFHLLSMALDPESRPMPVAPAFVYFQRARALEALAQFESAAAEYETAIHSAKDWRLHVVPADTFRISSDVSLQEMYSGYVDLAMRMYRRTGNPVWSRRAFNAAEANRAASLREALEQRLLSPEYWEDVEQLRAAVAKSDGATPAGNTEEALLRRRLSRYEVDIDVSYGKKSHQKKERSLPDISLSLQRTRLSADEALLSFSVAEHASYLWAITGHSFESHVLPGRKEMASALARFRELTVSSAASGPAIRSMLFGSLSSAVQAKKSWILSLDQTLHGFPFGALPEPGIPARYTAETRSIRIVPSAAMTGESVLKHVSDRFVAFADPIYNVADPRWTAKDIVVSGQLSRLPGTRREVNAGFAAWRADADTILMTGSEVTREAVQRATVEQSAVVHFGTHVVPMPGTQESVAIALGLNANGTPEYLTATDVARLRTTSGVVVLSGCGSGTGKSLPGAGLIGLTRAWLLAGAQAVTATYWPIPDDAQAFFSSFYRHLNARAGAGISASSTSAALREAQMEMIHGGGSHARPEYWAAFFVVGKD